MVRAEMPKHNIPEYENTSDKKTLFIEIYI